jgi:N-acetylglucosamine-6-phosphate deacetylase
MHLLARSYDTAEGMEITCASGRITAIRPLADGADQKLPLVAPGLVDIQVNGFEGQEFSSLDLTPQKVARIVRRHFDFGVTGICPTLTTQSFEVLAHGLRQIAAACEADPLVAHAVVGVHVEGPYITAEDGPRGAHPAEHCRPPDWDEFQRWQQAAGGRIKLMTLSPEYPQAPAFIRRAVASGVVIAIGHTAAGGDQIRAAADAGAQLSTHLGNGAHRMLRRHPNYLWDQLADDRLTASLICDGHHLPREVVQTFVRAKGIERIVLVSDVSGLAGLKPGRYQSSGCELEILPDGRLVIAGQDQLLAGASLPLTVGVANLVEFGRVSLPEALEAASLRPARLLGVPAGDLSLEARADLILFDWDDRRPAGERLSIRATLAGGELVSGRV